MSQRMQALQGALADVPDLKLVSITCDPDRDTKERLAQYSKGYNADPDRWFFVTGDKQSIQSFSIQTLKLGMQEATSEEQAKGMERIIHSSRLVLIDAKGRIRAYHNGIEEGATKRVADDVRALLAER